MAKQKIILDQSTIMQNFDTVVSGMDEERKQKFLQWVDVQSNYLQWETTFNPHKLLHYKRRDMVLMNFGFNVGSEIGGMHWAVVVENGATRGSDTVVVVPLSSLDETETEEDIHERTEVYIGTIPDINDKKVKACIGQIRPVSKLRLYKPKNKHQKRIRINEVQMNLIDDKIKELYTFNK